MIVDLPDPDEPTSAVTVPGFDSNEIPCSTGLSASYANSTSSNAHIARESCPVACIARRLGNPLRCSLRISVVRSSPASASVSCVPMFTSWTIGAIMNASNIVYCT